MASQERSHRPGARRYDPAARVSRLSEVLFERASAAAWAKRWTPLRPFEPAERGVYVVFAPGPLLPARVRALATHLVKELEKELR